MNPFDDENPERKKNPNDPFRIDDDIFRDIFNDTRIKDIFNDDRIMDDIKKMTEEMMKMFSNAQPGKPIVHGNEREYNLILSYKFLEGALRGLSFDAKGAVLDYTNSGRTGLQLRLIMNYEFDLL